MKRASLLLALTLFGALPALAQSTEFGILIGGGRRFVKNGNKEPNVPLQWLDSSFSVSNNSVDLFWATKIEEDVLLKIKGGRLETQIAAPYTIAGDTTIYRKDVEGEVQHAGLAVEYRFSESYGQSGIFAGLGLYRQTGEGIESTNNFGVSFGANVDLPITRTYGAVVEATYHWTRADYRPKYLTISAGLRASF